MTIPRGHLDAVIPVRNLRDRGKHRFAIVGRCGTHVWHPFMWLHGGDDVPGLARRSHVLPVRVEVARTLHRSLPEDRHRIGSLGAAPVAVRRSVPGIQATTAPRASRGRATERSANPSGRGGDARRGDKLSLAVDDERLPSYFGMDRSIATTSPPRRSSSKEKKPSRAPMSSARRPVQSAGSGRARPRRRESLTPGVPIPGATSIR